MGYAVPTLTRLTLLRERAFELLDPDLDLSLGGVCLCTAAEGVPSCNHSNDQPRQWP